MSELPLQFPVLVLGPQYGAWAGEGVELVEWHLSEDEFTTLDCWELKHRPHTEMLVVDANCRGWHVLSATNLGPTRSGVVALLQIIFRGDRRIRYELSETFIVFDDFRRRVCKAIQSNPDRWRDDEAIAGEDGPPRDEQEMLDELTGKVAQAANVREMVDVFERWAAE